jgi:peptidoglycan/LPS O-acetylase OafA/YrhL
VHERILQTMTANDSNSRQANNFGFLRLLFATLVILSHSPELVDGNQSREILTRLFGTVSFGVLAVDGFFLISGYLITQSLVNSRSYLEYLSKRVLRIYPGYIVAFAISLLIGGMAGGSISSPFQVLRQVAHAFSLHTPRLDGAFIGIPYPTLNGPMWTVAYEFRCYLFVMLLGTLGVLRSRLAYLVMTIALLVGMFSQRGFALPHLLESAVGSVQPGVRFCAIFCCGGIFFLFRDRISYTRKAAVIASAALLPAMFAHRFAEIALVTLGGYLLFWFAFEVKSSRLSRIGNGVDLSYGVYLYAWPIQSLLIWHYNHISPWLVFFITTMTAGVIAYASWTLIEQPFLSLKRLFAGAAPAPTQDLVQMNR